MKDFLETCRKVFKERQLQEQLRENLSTYFEDTGLLDGFDDKTRAIIYEEVCNEVIQTFKDHE